MQTSKTEFSTYDSDYTCPNFLQKLLGKTILTSQTNCSIRNIEETFESTPQRCFPSTMRTAKKAQTAKVLGQRVAKSKAQDLKTFGVFFKTILKQFKSSQQVDLLWNGFEEVMHSQEQVHLYVNDLKNNKKLYSIKKSEEIQNSLTQSSSKISQQTDNKIHLNKRISKTPNKIIDAQIFFRQNRSRSVNKWQNFSKTKLKKIIQTQAKEITKNLMRGDQNIKRK